MPLQIAGAFLLGAKTGTKAIATLEHHAMTEKILGRKPRRFDDFCKRSCCFVEIGMTAKMEGGYGIR